MIKKCNDCKLDKDISLFNKCKSNNDGLQYKCIECERKYRLLNRDRRIANMRIYTSEHKEDKKLYCKNNEEHLRNKRYEYLLANKEELAKKRAESYKINKETILYKAKIYRDNNKTKLYERNKKYLSTERGRINNNNHVNRRRDLKSKGRVSADEINTLVSNSKKCYWCECSLDKVKIHIDHYIPLSKGGSHVISNLVVSCSKCNLTKHAKDPIVYANSIGRLF